MESLAKFSFGAKTSDLKDGVKDSAPILGKKPIIGDSRNQKFDPTAGSAKTNGEDKQAFLVKSLAFKRVDSGY